MINLVIALSSLSKEVTSWWHKWKDLKICWPSILLWSSKSLQAVKNYREIWKRKFFEIIAHYGAEPSFGDGTQNLSPLLVVHPHVETPDFMRTIEWRKGNCNERYRTFAQSVQETDTKPQNRLHAEEKKRSFWNKEMRMNLIFLCILEIRVGSRPLFKLPCV